LILYGDFVYEEIVIKNFKSLKDVQIKPKLITVLIGPNSSGKSSVLQVLMALKQSIESSQLQLRGPYISLGDFKDVIYKTENERYDNIAIGLFGTFNVSKPLSYLPPAPPLRTYRLRYAVLWAFKDGDLGGRVTRASAGFHYGDLVLKSEWDVYAGSKVNQIKFDGITFDYHGNPQIGEPIIISASSIEGEGLADRQRRIREDLGTITLTIRKQLENTFLVPATRGQDQPGYDLLELPEADFVSTSGSSIQASKVASTLAYRRELEDEVSALTERITGVRINVKLLPKRLVTVEARTREPTIRVNVVNEGYGTNQLVHLLMQTVSTPKYSTIAIDDPEIHLHPKAQAELADILVEIAKNEHKQLLITTHSEHILFRLLTDVAKGKLSSNELAIYYLDKKKGVTTVKELKVDEKGTIEEGLLGFLKLTLMNSEHT